MNDGSAIANGAASADTDAGPRPSSADDRPPGRVAERVEDVGEERRLVSHLAKYRAARPSWQVPSQEPPAPQAALSGRRGARPGGPGRPCGRACAGRRWRRDGGRAGGPCPTPSCRSTAPCVPTRRPQSAAESPSLRRCEARLLALKRVDGASALLGVFPGGRAPAGTREAAQLLLERLDPALQRRDLRAMGADGFTEGQALAALFLAGDARDLVLEQGGDVWHGGIVRPLDDSSIIGLMTLPAAPGSR